MPAADNTIVELLGARLPCPVMSETPPIVVVVVVVTGLSRPPGPARAAAGSR